MKPRTIPSGRKVNTPEVERSIYILIYLKSALLWCLALKPINNWKEEIKSILLKHHFHLGLRLDCPFCLHIQLVIQYMELQIPKLVISGLWSNIYFWKRVFWSPCGRSGNSGKTWQLSWKKYFSSQRILECLSVLQSDKISSRKSPSCVQKQVRLYSFFIIITNCILLK